MSVLAEDRRSTSETTPGPAPDRGPTGRPAAGWLPPLKPHEIERITRATRRRPLVVLAANDKGGVGKTVLALNLASVLAHRGGGALRVLLLDQNPHNADLSDMLDVPEEVGSVLDRPPGGGRPTEHAYPVPGIPGLDAAFLLGSRFRRGEEFPYPLSSPRSLTDAAVGYHAVVVDTEKASPKGKTPGGRQLGLWLQEADVCYVTCDLASLRLPRVANFAHDARGGRGDRARGLRCGRLVCVLNKWPRGEAPWGGEASYERAVRDMGCDRPRGDAETFLKLPYREPLSVPRQGPSPALALADPDFGAAVSAVADDALRAPLEG